MRFLAVFLLLLNVAYLGWMQFGAGAPGPAEVEASDPGPMASGFVAAEKQLLLVSERPVPPPTAAVGADVAAALPAETMVAEVAGATEDPWCAMAGPFADSETAASFLAAVDGLGATGEVASEEFPVSSTWWVHLPQFPSEEAAFIVLAELQAKGIDSYYIRSGELAGAISLGVFSRSARANIAQQELSAKGYSPVVREIIRSGTRFNVSLRLENQQTRQSPEWSNLQANLQAAELQEIACK